MDTQQLKELRKKMGEAKTESPAKVLAKRVWWLGWGLGFFGWGCVAVVFARSCADGEPEATPLGIAAGLLLMGGLLCALIPEEATS